MTIAVMMRPLCYMPYFLWGPWMQKHPLGRMHPQETETVQPRQAAVAPQRD